MSRSKHTDPESIRARRRIEAPFASRAAGDLARRRSQGRIRKTGTEPSRNVNRRPVPGGPMRIVVREPRPGFLHPAGKADLWRALAGLKVVARYGLRTIELARRPAATRAGELAFGRYRTPGHVLLFEQPESPWLLPGLLPDETIRRFERCGAVVTRPGNSATRIEWPHGALRRFMLEDVLVHELGHHVLQHNRGKRTVRVARTRDHEAFATRFARRHPQPNTRRRISAG